MRLPYLAIIFSFLAFAAVSRASNVSYSGSAVTTRYWDCCKPSCSWAGKAHFSSPVQTCDVHDKPLSDFSAGTGCNGGTAYSCTNQSPWAVNDTFSYGFAGVFIKDHVEDYWCCACYQLTFTSGAIKGKTMVLQAHNTAYDITSVNRFALGVPGGNTSTSDACAAEFNVPQSVFGTPGVGVNSRSDCDNLPDAMKASCYWRFDWFLDTDDPTVDFQRVQCPAALTNITGCRRDDEHDFDSTSAAPKLLPLSSTATAILAIILSTSLLL
ncbi:hypothetical protein BU16DRAFT_548789 [Lophium mytilinum]|uniref:Cellulase n=1 Tax=Lophium mytilinum TaxID=390894 RepID=A0A6A6R1B2_9PEZI|nr:hypothetical protein BU16DRAFT_548789 [Lophium mytilinum]